jgi:hypothetical protein
MAEPLSAGGATGTLASRASAERHMPDDPQEPATIDVAAIENHLATELGDRSLARELARLIVSDVLTWRPPRVIPGQVNTIVAYAFGNRIDANGNRSPGPVNEALADLLVRLQQETGAAVFAQWAVAAAVGGRVPADRLTAITPLLNAQAETVYLSTGGVAAEIIRRVGDPARLGQVGVLAFRDHVKRCVDTSRRFGMAAAAPAGYELPGDYDTLSGQPWTRSRLAYLMHDLRCRTEDRRDQLIA